MSRSFSLETKYKMHFSRAKIADCLRKRGICLKDKCMDKLVDEISAELKEE